MVTNYYFPFTAFFEPEAFVEVNKTMAKFGFKEKIGMSGEVGGTTMTVTADTELPPQALIEAQKILQEVMNDKLKDEKLQITVGPARKLTEGED